MRKSLTSQLEFFLRNKEWFAKGTLTADMVWKHQSGKHYGARYLPETVGRALRHLEEGRIIAVKDDGISVQYKWLPNHLRQTYIPYTQRPAHAKHVLFKTVDNKQLTLVDTSR